MGRPKNKSDNEIEDVDPNQLGFDFKNEEGFGKFLKKQYDRESKDDFAHLKDDTINFDDFDVEGFLKQEKSKKTDDYKAPWEDMNNKEDDSKRKDFTLVNPPDEMG